MASDYFVAISTFIKKTKKDLTNGKPVCILELVCNANYNS